MSRIKTGIAIYHSAMAATSTLLCVHRDPGQLTLLRENGYELVTTSSRREGLRLFNSRSVDAIVLEHYEGIPDSGAIAEEIKQACPDVPIVLLTDHLELSDSDLKSVDALVLKADGPQFLLATVHFVLTVKPAARRARNRRLARRSRVDFSDDPLPAAVWKRIKNGTFQF